MTSLTSLFALLALAPASTRGGDTPTGPPNILVILMDDIGVEQLECYDATPPIGSTLTPGSNQYQGGSFTPSVPYGLGYAPTPSITSIAEDGVRFSRCFTSSTCSPTRAQFMTGRYPFRTGIGTIVNPEGLSSDNESQQVDLAVEEIILPEVLALSNHGYQTAYFGKWHLARDPSNEVGVGFQLGALQTGNPVLDVPGDSHPVLSGWPIFQGHMHNLNVRPNPLFDSLVPFCEPGPDCSAGYNYWFHVTSVAGLDPSLPAAITSRTTTDNLSPADYATTRQRREVQQWIQSTAGPWCAVWATSAPHGPFDWPPGGAKDGACDCGLPCAEELHGYGCDPPDANVVPRRTFTRYRAIVEALDTEIGRLRANLGPDVWANTVVMVVSDNGTPKTVVRAAEFEDAGLMFPYLPCTAANFPPCNALSPSSTNRFKGSPFVTGTNVPLIVSGPPSVVNRSLRGTRNDALIDMVDLFDTIRDIAGVDRTSDAWSLLYGPSTIDGISFLEVLQGIAPSVRNRSLALNYTPNGPFTCRTDQSIGFTMELGTGEVYRLIRTGICGQTSERLYRLVDGLGCVEDWLEELDLAAFDPNLTVVSNALDALLDEACASGGCASPCSACPPCGNCP